MSVLWSGCDLAAFIVRRESNGDSNDFRDMGSRKQGANWRFGHFALYCKLLILDCTLICSRMNVHGKAIICLFFFPDVRFGIPINKVHTYIIDAIIEISWIRVYGCCLVRHKDYTLSI